MSVINNELTCLALTGCVPLNARRRSASCVVEGIQSDATQLKSTQLNSTGRRRGVQSDSTHNSTQLDVELSWVELCRYKRGWRLSQGRERLLHIFCKKLIYVLLDRGRFKARAIYDMKGVYRPTFSMTQAPYSGGRGPSSKTQGPLVSYGTVAHSPVPQCC